MLTQALVRELFDYDPETGHLMSRRLGRRVGSVNGQGRRFITALGSKVSEHRVIWLWMTGRWPSEVDHINGDPADNRWANLREATRAQNLANRKSYGKHLKGVSRAPGRDFYNASIRVLGTRLHLGSFRTEQEAHDAYWTAAQKYFGKFARKE